MQEQNHFPEPNPAYVEFSASKFIIHILKAKVLFMHITDHMHVYVQNIKCTRCSRLPIAYFVFSFLIFPWPIHMFLQKDWGKEGSLLQAVKKYSYFVISFLIYFPLTQTIFFSKNIEEKKRFLLQAVKKYSYFVFCFLIFPPPDPSVSPKRLRKRRVRITAGG
jgi:hypothetical protein